MSAHPDPTYDPSDMEPMFKYLDELRESGVVNMYGARPYLCEAFTITKEEAGQVLSAWMKSYPGRRKL